MISGTVLSLLFSGLLYGLVALIRMNPGGKVCPSTFHGHDLKRPWFTVAFPGTRCKVNEVLMALGC